MTAREAAGIINAIKCSTVTTPKEHEALIMAERVLLKAEPKHGRWVEVWGGRWHACSVCEGIPPINAKFEDLLTPYCPHCGAKMDEAST